MTGPGTAEDSGIVGLHRAGTLATRYPDVAALLAGLPEEELARAGRLLARLDPDEVAAAHPETPAVTVAITGHGTLSELVAPLTAQLARHGLLLRPRMSAFDSYVFDLADPSSDLYAADPDLVLCVLDPSVVFDTLPVPWGVDDVAAALAARLDTIASLAVTFAATARGTLVLNTLPLLSRHTGQLLDHRSRARLGTVWRDANARLLQLAEEHGSVVVLDLDPLLAEGIPAEDVRLSVYAGAHLSPGLLARYAREVGHLARSVTGRTKKVLVLDLDETLWGGVLGEDGIDGIEPAGGRRGAAFRAFQRVVKQIGSQGVLLAVASKNDPEPVRKVLREHPEMTLGEADFVRVSAGWGPKHTALAELAEALNLGLDGFVFVDDSTYECGLVARELPSVTVLNAGTEPALHVATLLRDGWFDTRELTSADSSRTVQYRAELDRRDFLDSAASVEDYLRELDVTVRLGPVQDTEVPRVAQLTLRTNQFNLTTERLQPHEVRALAADPNALTLAVHAGDRFGDSGLVGAVFARRDGGALHIDNFLLSCRVFSRGIEQACLTALLEHARRTGAKEVVGRYHPTAKNGKVADFYPRNGFGPGMPDGTATVFRHDLTEITSRPVHVRMAARLEGTADGDR